MEEIIVLFKTHLDVGYTDFARNVKAKYLRVFIPAALRVAKEMRGNAAGDRFIWTSGSWLIDEFLRAADGPAKREMETAIAAGDICWHGLPFTTHTELMDSELFEYGLSISQKLDRRFGKKTIAAKMTDVPGHTKAMIPCLAKAGIEFLHIGVNPVSVCPQVPPLFRWRAGDGSSVVVMYCAGYGGYAEIGDSGKAVLFAHTGDNNGPQSGAQIQGVFDRLREKYPSVKIRAGNLNDVALAVREIRKPLPVVTSEIGDTWIHGAASDPGKISRYRSFLRERLAFDAENREAADRWLINIPEHTWGLDYKTWLNDHQNYARRDFEAVKGSAPYRKMEASWAEQRAYIGRALDALEPPLREKLRPVLEEDREPFPDLSAYRKVEDTARPVRENGYSVQFDRDGAVVLLEKDHVSFFDREHRLGVFSYEAFSRKETDRFFDQYTDFSNFPELRALAAEDFNKIGEETAISRSLRSGTKLAALYQRSGELLAVLVPRDSAVSKLYGCPPKMMLRLTLTGPRVFLDFAWWDKPASRVAEGLWLGFRPRSAGKCFVRKLGRWIDPLDVVPKGNRKMHATDWGVRFDRLQIESLDAAVVNIGGPSLWDFNDRLPDVSKGVSFSLFNNQWNTNFPLWYGGDARFRFLLSEASSTKA